MSDWFGHGFRSALASGTGLALTGAGSWLGRALLDALAAEGLLPARLRLFASHARPLRLGGRDLAIERLADAPRLAGADWLLLHFAFLGKERTAELSTKDFIAANQAILDATLRIAEAAAGLRMVFASSGAAYGPGRALIGDPDASPYGWCKVAQESALTAWCAARGVPLVMPRIFNIGGPGITKQEGYALSSFILSARREGVIRIAARRPVFRSFVHVNELNALLCEAALARAPGTPLLFDTAGVETVEMADLAAAVAARCAPASIRIEREDPPEGEVDWYVGDGATYRGLLARAGRRVVGLDRIIGDTAGALSG